MTGEDVDRFYGQGLIAYENSTPYSRVFFDNVVRCPNTGRLITLEEYKKTWIMENIIEIILRLKRRDKVKIKLHSNTFFAIIFICITIIIVVGIICSTIR